MLLISKNMKKSSKPNISPLEMEIESKVNISYLSSIAAKANQLNIIDLFKALYGQETELTISKSSTLTTKITEHGITKLISNYKKSQNKTEKANLYHQLIQQIKKDR
jgi:hypothetical protein